MTTPGSLLRCNALRQLLRVLVVWGYLRHFVEAALLFAVQDDGPSSSYASSMYFDSVIERVQIVGTIYREDYTRECFMGSLQLPQVSDNNRGATWVRHETYGQENVSVSCSSIFMAQNQGIRTYFLLGYSEVFPDFLSNDALGHDGKNESEIYGFTMELNFAAYLTGGVVEKSDRVQYPIAITGNGTEGTGLFVATIHANTSYSGSSYEHFLKGQDSLQPESDASRAFLPPRFDKGFSIKLTKLEQTNMNGNVLQGSPSTNSTLQEYSNLAQVWTTELKTIERDSVFLSSMMTHPQGDLLLAGYTAGTGSNYGSDKKDGSIDSFVTSLNPRTGETERSMRLQSLSNSTDLILGMCARGVNTSSFYVVGMTNELTGDAGSYKAFVLKLELSSFAMQWSVEFKALPTDGEVIGDVQAMSCAVTSDDEVLYVGGTVTNGASVTLDGKTAETNSSGKDDIFVAQLRTSDGAVKFITQIGTRHDDRMASGNALATDNQGNAVVLGNTKGSLFREKSSYTEGLTNDIVIFSIDRASGNYMQTVNVSGEATFTNSPTVRPTSLRDPTSTPTMIPTLGKTTNSSTAPSSTKSSHLPIAPNTTGTSSESSPTADRHDTNSSSVSTPGNSANSLLESNAEKNNSDSSFSMPPNSLVIRPPSSSSSESMNDPSAADVSSSGKSENITLIVSIGVLVAIILLSCAMIFFIRYKRNHKNKADKSLWYEDYYSPSHQDGIAKSVYTTRNSQCTQSNVSVSDEERIYHQDLEDTQSSASYRSSSDSIRSPVASRSYYEQSDVCGELNSPCPDPSGRHSRSFDDNNDDDNSDEDSYAFNNKTDCERSYLSLSVDSVSRQPQYRRSKSRWNVREILDLTRFRLSSRGSLLWCDTSVSSCATTNNDTRRGLSGRDAPPTGLQETPKCGRRTRLSIGDWDAQEKFDRTRMETLSSHESILEQTVTSSADGSVVEKGIDCPAGDGIQLCDDESIAFGRETSQAELDFVDLVSHQDESCHNSVAGEEEMTQFSGIFEEDEPQVEERNELEDRYDSSTIDNDSDERGATEQQYDFPTIDNESFKGVMV